MPLVSRFVRYAPKVARYLVTTLADNLPDARRLVISPPLSREDGGAGGDYTVSIDGASTTSRGAVKLAGQLGGTADAPDVRGIVVTVATIEVPLSFGAVADGQALVRSGTTVVGADLLPTSGGTLTGELAMGGHKVTGLASGTAPGDAATYGQVAALLNGLDWQASVLNQNLTSPPGSPSTGNRHLIAASATGAWSGKDGQITTYDGSAWTFTVPNQGMTVHVEAEGADYVYNGSAWVNIGASVDHAALLNLGTGDPHPQYQLSAGREAASGYAGLGSDTLPIQPTKGVRAGSDPSSPAPGEVWVNGTDLKFRNNDGTPVTDVVERLSRRNQASGYAGLDGTGRVGASQAPAKSTYATGGNQALVASDIAAAPQSRLVTAGTGLSGGGDLSVDRTVSIAAFSGIVAKDFDPASGLNWSANETKVHVSFDIGAEGMLVPIAMRLPPCVDAALRTEVVFEFDDASTRTLSNGSTGSNLDQDANAIAGFLSGDLSNSAINNGKRVRRLILQTRNTSGATISSIDIGIFRIRAWAMPRGGGAAL